MPEERFRVPGSSYDELIKIIRAYAAVNKEADLDEVSRLATMHPTSISRNNAFLIATGLIEGGKKKVISDKGRALARAFDHEMPDEIRTHWRSVVMENEFLQKVLGAVRIRKGMEPSTLQSHIAYSAGQPKTTYVMAGAAAVIDILKAAELIRESEGKFIATTSDASDTTPAVPSAPYASARALTSPSGRPYGGEVAAAMPIQIPAASGITIQIQIQCSADDIETLGPRLRALLDELSRPSAQRKE